MFDYIIVSTEQLSDTSNRSVTHVEGLIGLPAIRGTAYDRPDQDGGVEPPNQLLPARPVSMDFETWGESVADARLDFGVIVQALEAMSTTGALIKYRFAGDVTDLQMTGKFVGECLPVIDANDQGAFFRANAQFRCADPRAYSQISQSASTGAPSTTGGMPYPIAYPIQYGLGISGGFVIVTNNGNTISWPDIFVAGPINGPVVSVGGSSLFFPGLTLGLGQTLAIATNPARRSMTVGGVNAVGSLRFADSVFAGLLPGVDTNVSFYAIGGGTTADTNLTVAWRDAYTV